MLWEVTNGMRIRGPCLVGLLMLFLPVSGCDRNPAAPPGPAVAIAYPTSVSTGLVHIALEKGFFARRGARIRPVAYESGKVALDRMLAGEADLAVAAETPIARAIMAGGRLKILAAVEQSGRNICVVARKDRGIERPSDLRGKTIGYTNGTSAHYFLDTFLLANGIGTGDVRRLALPPSDLRKALVDGRVDAASTWHPHVAYLLAELGERGIRFRDEFIYTETVCLVARPEFVRDHPGRARALIEGLVDALALTVRAPREAQAIVAAYTRIEPAVIERVWGDHDFVVGLDQSLVTSLEDECRWVIETGDRPGPAMPDLLDYLHLPGLLAVRPEAVQVIRNEEGAGR